MPPDDTNIFVFTAGNSAAREHLETSIRKPLSLDRVKNHFSSDYHGQLEGFDEEYGLYAWGAVPGPQNISRWQSLKINDWVLCVYDSRYHFVCQVLGKQKNREFALDIWGTDPDGKTWELMYFLSTPTEINIPVSEMSEYLNSGYMGFTRIGDEKIANIRSRFGSVDRFVEKALLSGESVSTEELPYLLIRSNEGTNWDDEAGRVYRFGSTVPNYVHLLKGAHVVVDSRIDGDVALTGYGMLENASTSGTYQRERREGTHYESKFNQWHPFNPPRPIPNRVMGKIKALEKYNVQHAIRRINKEIYDELCKEAVPVINADGNLMKDLSAHCSKYVASKGFSFDQNDIANFLLSIKTKPFVILAGISGTGKSKLVQLIGDAVGASVVLIPVKPDWSDNTDLIGYEDFQQQFRPAKLTETLVKAHESPDTPFFVLLDEMNLARVEHYFSDFLSVMETRDWRDGSAVTKPICHIPGCTVVPGPDAALIEEYLHKGLTIPNNVYIFGTVNMDETTHPFSRKVLDRANSIEFNRIDLPFSEVDATHVEPKIFGNGIFLSPYLTLRDVYQEDPPFFEAVIQELQDLNEVLETRGFHVGYRLRDEVCFYMYLNETSDLLPRQVAMDYQIHQKILPRVYGGEEVRPIIESLEAHCEASYPMSLEKLRFMKQRLQHGFTSFWL